MARPKVGVGPVKRTRVDHELDVLVRYVAGYVATCTCGAPFTMRRTFAGARADANDHRLDEHKGDADV